MYNQANLLQWKPLNFKDFSISCSSVLPQHDGVEPKEEVFIETSAIVDQVDQVDQDLASFELEQLKAQITEQAYQEGLALGQQDGFLIGQKSGYEAGYQQGIQAGQAHIEQQLDEEKLNAVQTIANLIMHFHRALNELDDVIVPKLMDLALVAAEKLVGSLPKAKQKQLMLMIKTLMQQSTLLSDPVQVLINPDDLTWLEPLLNEEIEQLGWQWIADSSIEVGGCKIIAKTNEIDATVTSQWQAIIDCVHEEQG